MVRISQFTSLVLLGVCVLLVAALQAQAQQSPAPAAQPSVIREIRAPSERLEMTVNESRILTLSTSLTKANRIPQAQVNNREILDITPLSPTQIQIFAKKPGVTQVNIWDENNNVYTVDVIVYGDARELEMVLKSEFPNAALRVKPLANGVLISGYVDKPEDVSVIVQIAEQYYPKVLTNIRVGGVQQVLLHVKAMEVSRTKLRQLGLDWSTFTSDTLTESMASGLLSGVTRQVISTPGGGDAWGYSPGTAGTETFRFSVIDGEDAFLAVLDALRRDSLMKVLAEPTLVTVSGRPAFFQVGGEVPTLVPAGLGVVSVEYKRYGTQVDFVPIVLGNGRIRLEVRPRVSDIDSARSITLDGQTIYAFNTREVDTGVELEAGQTLAIAGLVQNRVEAERRGIPFLSELPYVGAAFRRVEERVNEVELLILVTPELVEAVDADQIPPNGPGSQTRSPTDCELYLRGFVEVPLVPEKACNTCSEKLPGMLVPAGANVEDPEAILTPAELPGYVEANQQAVNEPEKDEPVGSAQSSAATSDTTQPSGNSGRVSDAEMPGLLGPVGYDGGQS